MTDLPRLQIAPIRLKFRLMESQQNIPTYCSAVMACSGIPFTWKLRSQREQQSSLFSSSRGTMKIQGCRATDGSLEWISAFLSLPTTPSCVGTIGDFVWNDADQDGIQNDGPQRHLRVMLILTGTDDFGQPVNLFTATNDFGFYEFTGLCPGQYRVAVASPPRHDPNLSAQRRRR